MTKTSEIVSKIILRDLLTTRLKKFEQKTIFFCYFSLLHCKITNLLKLSFILCSFLDKKLEFNLLDLIGKLQISRLMKIQIYCIATIDLADL